jgi:hypothetical protein
MGYSVNNIVSCCAVCNKMKSDIDKEEWMNKMLTILKHQGVI